MRLYKAHVAERVSLPERFANPIDVDKSSYHHLSQNATKALPTYSCDSKQSAKLEARLQPEKRRGLIPGFHGFDQSSWISDQVPNAIVVASDAVIGQVVARTAAEVPTS